MPDPEKIAIVVSEWVTKAENDLKNAVHALKLGQDCPTDTVLGCIRLRKDTKAI